MSAVAAVRLTDPAFEFSVLADRLRNYKQDTGIETYRILSSFIGVDENSPYLFELIGYVGARSVSLIDFISQIDDDFIDDATRNELIRVVTNMSQIISPKYMGKPWNSIGPQYLINSEIITLRQFSQTARRYKPLRLVTKEERAKAIQSVDEAIEEASTASGVPAWAVAPLVESLRRLKTMLQHFDFFGHEAIIDHVMRMNGEANAASESLKEAGIRTVGKFFKTAVAISTVVTVLVTPINAYQGYKSYRSYALKFVEKPPALLAPPPPQLPAPSQAAPADEAGPSVRQGEQHDA